MGNQFNQGVQPSQAAFNAANPFMTHSNIAQPPQQSAKNSLDQVSFLTPFGKSDQLGVCLDLAKNG